MRKKLAILVLILGLAGLARAQQKWTLSAAATTCTTSNTSCLIYLVDAASGGATFTVGANASANTLQFEASGDGGATWVAFNVTPSNGTTAVTSTTSTGTWQGNIAGYTAVRIRMSTLVSGTATVSIITSLASARSGGGGGGAASGLTFGGTTINTTSTAPTSGQCVEYNGTGLTGASCSATAAGVEGSIQLKSSSAFAGTAASLKCTSAMTGANWGAKANTCIAALPAGGGFADMSELNGAQTLGTAITIPGGVTLYCGADTQLSQTAAVTISNTKSAFIGSPDQSCVITKAANLDQITVSANSTSVQNLTLVGVAGSFTGNGITVTTLPSYIVNNNISGEASSAINDSGGSTVLQNTVSGGTSTAVMTIGTNSNAVANTCTATAGDCIDLNGNQVRVISNLVSLSPSSSVSGLCGINAKTDQIGDRIAFNQISITDSNSGDLNYGECDTPTGTHNLNMVFEGDNITGTLSGGATADGFFLNNAAGLNTNWSLVVRDVSCVHITNCVKRTDAQNNVSVYEDIQPGDTTLDAGTGSTNDIWLLDNGTTAFASLPSPAGVGSRALCSNCNFGKTVTQGSGGGASQIFRQNVSGQGTKWFNTQPFFMQVTTTYTNATTTPSNIAGLSFPVAASTDYSMHCWMGWSASANTAGLDITITGPASPTLVVYSYTETQNGAVTPQSNDTASFGTKLTGTASLTATQGIAVIDMTLLNGTNAGTVQVQGSATGTGTITVNQNGYCTAN